MIGILIAMKTWMNTSRQCIIKSKVLREGTNGIIVSRKSVADHNMLPATWSFKCKRRPDWTISKFKARYFVRGDIQKRLSPKPLNSYSTVVQWATVRLMLILQCKSQIIDFTNVFAHADIPIGEPVSIELPRDLKSDVGQHDVVLKIKKSLYGQAEAARIWYKN